MPRNFKPCDRDQMLLLPPSLRDWLPPGDLAWFVADATAQIDLRPFLKGYREDGRGGSGYHPEMLVALLLYAYRRGVSSSREIERRCSLDVGFRAVMAQQTPDHATIARFRRQFMPELSGLFTTILRMCAQAGLVKLGTISIDGTKLEANAARSAGHTADRLGEMARELLEKAEAADRAEDELHGPDRRGDELPAALADPKTRPAALRQAEVRPNHAYAGPRPRPGSAPRRPRSTTTTSARSERPCRAKSAARRPSGPTRPATSKPT